MALNHEHGRSDATAKVARKLLRLNPGDNLGVRYLLPFVLLEKAELAAAKRSLRALADEIGLTAAVARAFVAFAKDERATFRRELATALFTLPMLRALLLNSPKALPAGESGIGRSNRTWRRLQSLHGPATASCPGCARRASRSWLSRWSGPQNWSFAPTGPDTGKLDVTRRPSQSAAMRGGSDCLPKASTGSRPQTPTRPGHETGGNETGGQRGRAASRRAAKASRCPQEPSPRLTSGTGTLGAASGGCENRTQASRSLWC